MNPAPRRAAWAAAALSAWVALAAGLGTLAGCATPSVPQLPPPIVFVHGNGDNAASWMTTLWRFESQAWPRDRLDAVELPDPLARDDDTVAQPGRSSTADSARALAAEVDAVLQRTGAARVVLVGNSRGGYAIRNYVQNFGGAAKVERVVLGGTPNHGVWADPAWRPNSEFNGAGPFLTALNAPKGRSGDEVTPGPAWMTIRSDRNDKFAQPDGTWIGAPGRPTHVGYDGPALKGALNVVLPGRDHRETSYHAESFAITYEFITGHPPASTAIVAEPAPRLDGRVSGYGPAGFDNRPLAGAMVEVYAVDAETGRREGAAVHRKTIGPDGRWGPFQATAGVAYEFVVSAPGHATTHIYRSPFPRSSDVVDLRAERLTAADRQADAVVRLVRPRGYFGLPRDQIELDGRSPPAGIPTGVAGVGAVTVSVAAGQSVHARYSSGGVSERLAGLAWPTRDNQVTLLELME